MLTPGDLVRLDTKGASDYDGTLGVVLAVDEPWYASISGHICKVFFPAESDIRYYNRSNLEKLT